MQDTNASLEMLTRAHIFPGPYTFKAIGQNGADFVARVMQAVVVVLGPTSLPQVATRQSAQGRHQSVNLTVQVADAQQVLDVYSALRRVEGLKMLL